MSEVILSDNSMVYEDQQAKDWTPAKMLYTGLMAFNLLSFLWLLATGSGIEMPPVIWIARIATTPLAIYLGKLWKDRGFQILAIYTCLFFFRVMIHNTQDIFSAELAESILSALWLFAGCYGMSKVLSNKEIRRLLLICSSIWMFCICIYSCIGIFAAWTDQTIKGLVNGYFTTGSGRLELLYLATTSGIILEITSFISAVLMISLKQKWQKMLIVIMSSPVFVALALTDSRTAFICTAIGISMIMVIIIYSHLKNKKYAVTKNRSILWILIIISIFIVSSIVLIVLMRITPIFNGMRQRGLVSSAFAEEVADRTNSLTQRGFTNQDILSGRWKIWRDQIQYMIETPVKLLIGDSKVSYQKVFHGHLYAHSHSLFFQVFLESGIPGLLLVLSFIGHTFAQSKQIYKLNEASITLRCIPIIILCLWLGDIVECITWLRSSQCIMSTVLFICAGIVNTQTYCLKQKSITNNAI